MFHIGIDEAGRGPAIGPLVVCALAMPESEKEILRLMGCLLYTSPSPRDS